MIFWSVCLLDLLLILRCPQSSKKTDAPSPDDKKKINTAPVAPAGGEKKEEGGVKKRK
jgi:hypothetical protein